MVTTKIKRVRSRRRYPEHLKRKIAKSYLAGEASYAVLAEENDLSNKGVVKEFVKWYKAKLAAEPKYELMLQQSDEKSQAKSSQSSQSSQELAEENAELKRLLRLSELKTEGLETMINIAEETLKINIRKKSGAKRSKR